jgi:branched-chain amino acid transport system ATP-binding protein
MCQGVHPGGGGEDVAMLEIHALHKSFGGLVAVNDFHLGVGEREILGLIGPNGAGKTTVFNMIACYFPPDAGDIVFQGHKLAGLRPYQACDLGISRTFQVTRPFVDSTVLENVMVGAFRRARSTREARHIALQVLDSLAFSQRRDVTGHELTVAERKRLELARALATGPKLLLLDEPMAGLNATEKTHLLQLLRDIRDDQGLTMILVEHDMKAVMSVCERIVLLHRGEKLLEGSPDEVAHDPRAISAYLGEDYATA